MNWNKPNTVTGFLSMAVTATHQFKCCYSEIKDLPSGRSITSPTFSVAGHNCNILYYPQGSKDSFIKLTFVLQCKSAVTAAFGFVFLDKHGKPASKASDRSIFTFSHACERYKFMNFIDKSDLEAEFVKDDYITLFFSVTIQSNNSRKEVPKQLVNGIVPFTINEQFAELLENKEMADITFEVGGEIFTAHKSILSVRSPVFKAEFFGGMAESKMKSIQIKEIKPVIFKAMLHFIYTDSFPDMPDEDTPLVTQVQHLLKAADRYGLEGLKMICEEVLIRNIAMDAVISSLALAEEHDCQELKNACLGSASEPEILVQLALKSEYVQLMQQYPSMLKSLNDSARDNDDFCYIMNWKKQRYN